MNLEYSKPSIKAIVTTVGPQKIDFMQTFESHGLDEVTAKRLSNNFGFESRYIVGNSGIKVSDLCINSALKIFEENIIDPHEIDGLILVTQTPDYLAPSTAIIIQNKLGLKKETVAFDINLGCSGYVNGLNVCYSLIESGLENILLLTGDTASKYVDPKDHTIAPIMGDAGSATLISRNKEIESASFFNLYSDGSGFDALSIKDGNHYSEEYKSKPYMKMDGKAVFNFTIQRVPSCISNILESTRVEASDIDFFVLHQPNKYILKMVQKKLGLTDGKIPMKTQSIYGNQNSSSIPGTINGFLSKEFTDEKLKLLFCGFGIGLSWGACIIETNKIFAPTSLIYKEK